MATADGCRFDTTGAVSSERGRTTLYTISGSQAINGHLDTYRGGVKRRLTKAGSTLYEDGTSIGSTVGSGYASMVSFNDRVYIGDSNGINTWDGTTLQTTIGLTKPTTAATVAVSGSGNLIATGTYKYAYTYFNGVAESNFSPISAGIAVTLGEQVDVSAITAGPAGTTHRHIYRTDLNGSTLFYLGEITDNTTLTYTDIAKLPQGADPNETPGATIKVEERPAPEITERQPARYPPDTIIQAKFGEKVNSSQGPDQSAEGPQVVMSNLGALADWTDHDPAPSDLEGLIFHQGQLFGFASDQIRFSRVNEPEHWPLFNAFKPGRRNAEKVMALVPLGGSIVIYTDSNIYMFSPIGLSFETGELKDMLSPVGLASKQGVVPIVVGAGQEAAHLFIAKSGVYLFDGTRVREISFKIENIFTDPSDGSYVNQDSISKARAVVWRDKVWLSYANGTGDNDRTIFIDFQDTQDPKFSLIKYGYSTLVLEKRDSIPVGGTSSGGVVQVDTGEANQGGDLLWAIKTKEYPITTNNTQVGLESIVLDADFGGASTSIALFTDTGKTASFTYAPTTTGRERVVRDLPHSLKGRRVFVTIQSLAQSERHLYGVGFTYQPEGVP